MQIKQSRRLSGRNTSVLAFIALWVLAAMPAFATVQGSTVPFFPATTTVGASFVGILTIFNSSTGTNASHTLNLSQIFITPSCAAGTTLCTTPDKGVFALLNPLSEAFYVCYI